MAKRSRKKNPVAIAFAKLRAKKLTPERRSEIARKAARARWAKAKRAAKPGRS